MSAILGAIVGGDGALTIKAPEQIHQVSIDSPKNVQVVQIRAIGPALALLATDCHGAQLSSVDTSVPGTIAYSTAASSCTSGDCSADRSSLSHRSKHASEAGCACSGEGCDVACKSGCYGAEYQCVKACEKTPEAVRADAIGACIQTDCAEACASVIR